ncbi:hypothetical protein NN3_04180 [Nocardia neocaledoniensis NBRC 108232]|uniref:hypothetical protein n=1 Tax=Nocardia neocaledoniensis TaxID=236511 RepID=UPI000D70B45E|nr:hypothetical protein [Nocardia neocaledoniensis]GEM29411.1 hypothetical protein NN3_04180 [Nocardia neocaledoniensis NBRC 108232]
MRDGWGDSLLFPGTRIAAIGAVLAALMLVLVLISLLIARGQNHPPVGYGHHGHVDSRPGPATPPHHPYR